jgi:hypothetical protein
VAAALTRRTAARLEREFNEIVPELATAIKALIRGYMPPELRTQPFTLNIEVTRDGAAPRRATAKKLAPRK